MSVLAEAKFDICRNYRLAQILKNEFGWEETKKELFEYFYGAFCESDVFDDDEESPIIAGLRDEISCMEDENIEFTMKNKQLEEEVVQLRDEVKRLRAAKQEG